MDHVSLFQNLTAVTLPRGEVWNGLYAMLPELLLLGGIGIALAFAIAWLANRCPDTQLGQWLCRQPSGRFEAVGWLVALALFIGIVDGASFQVGFFRQDDFSFLAVAQSGISLGQQMVMYHNDHLYLLFRLQVAALLSWAGPGATETDLAFWFNLLCFIIHVTVICAAVWLLAEAGARRGTLVIFALFVWAWPGWGEYTTGYYTIGVYVQVLALGIAGMAALLRYLRTEKRRWQCLALFLGLLACGLNITGIWTIVAQGIAVVCLRWPVFRDHQARRHLVISGVTFFCAAFLLTVTLRHDRSPREYVQNPAGTTVSDQITTLRTQSLASVFLTTLSTPGGILLSQAVPTVFQFSAEKIKAKPFYQLGFCLLQTLPLVFVVVWWFRHGRHHNPNRTRLLTAIFLIVIALSVMVILGRPDYAISHPVLFWNPKYQLFPWVWVTLGGALVLETVIFFRRSPPEVMMKMIGNTGLLCALFLLSHTQLERALFSKPIPYWSKGRFGNTVAAEARRIEYRTVMSALESGRISSDTFAVILPPWLTWYRDFSSDFPLLEWSGNENPYGVTYLFEDLPAARPASSTTILLRQERPSDPSGIEGTAPWYLQISPEETFDSKTIRLLRSNPQPTITDQ